MSLTRCDSSRTINLKLAAKFGKLCGECGNDIDVLQCFDCFSIKCSMCRGSDICCPADGGSYVDADGEIEYAQGNSINKYSTRKCSQCRKWVQFDDNISDMYPCVTLYCNGAVCTECSNITGDCSACSDIDFSDRIEVASSPQRINIEEFKDKRCCSCENYSFTQPLVKCLTCDSMLCQDCIVIGVTRCIRCNRQDVDTFEQPVVEQVVAPTSTLENNIAEYTDIDAIDDMHKRHKAIAKKNTIERTMQQLRSVDVDTPTRTFTCSTSIIDRFTQALNNIDARLGAVEMGIADIDRKIDVIMETVDEYDDRLESINGCLASIVD